MTDGCLFMPGMARFCGHILRIEKVVNNIYDEYQGKMFQTKNPLYILEQSICDGNSQEFPMRCDRTCFFLWHERWLNEARD